MLLRLLHPSCSRQPNGSSPRRPPCRTSALGVVTAEPVERLSPDLKQLLDGHWRVDDALDPQQLVEAVRGLSKQMGPVERLVGALEQLQVPMAYAREVLGIDG